MDSSIVLRTKNGEVAAFTELYNQTHDKAYSVAFSILKDEFEAEDIVQEAYIVVMEKLDDLKNPDRFESWFYQIVRTRSLNDLKKKRPTTFTSLESIEDPEIRFVDTVESDYTPFDPEASVDEAETRRLVRDMVFSLPEMQKKCILMRYQGDMKVCDIAKALNIPESTVKSNLNYGRKKIEESVRSMEQKGVKLYSVSPTLVLPLLREVLFMGLASGGRSDDDSKGGSVLAEAGRAGIRVLARRIVAGVCATFAIGGAAVGLNSRQSAPAPEAAALVADAPEPTHCIPEDINAEALVTVWKEGSIPGDIPNTYRLPALSLDYGSTVAFQKWVDEQFHNLSLNLEYYDKYLRNVYHYEGDLHFDFASEIFGNVLTVMFTVNDFPAGLTRESIAYDLTTGDQLTMDQLAEYAGETREFLEDLIRSDLREQWAMEDEFHGSIEGIAELREKTLARDLWGTTHIMIRPYCKGLGYDDPSYGAVTLCVQTCYLIDGTSSTLKAMYHPYGNEYYCTPYIHAAYFSKS